MNKPKIASDWMCGCAGCHMSLLDMDERILQVVELADLRSTPITDLKEPDESGVDVGVLEGGINNSANEEVAHQNAQTRQDPGGAGRLRRVWRRACHAQLLRRGGSTSSKPMWMPKATNPAVRSPTTRNWQP